MKEQLFAFQPYDSRISGRKSLTNCCYSCLKEQNNLNLGKWKTNPFPFVFFFQGFTPFVDDQVLFSTILNKEEKLIWK